MHPSTASADPMLQSHGVVSILNSLVVGVLYAQTLAVWGVLCADGKASVTEPMDNDTLAKRL